MKLRCVTFTGADDHIAPIDLVTELSRYANNKKVDFKIEWAILFHPQKEQLARYPSMEWVDEVLELSQKYAGLNLAAHFCGDYTKKFLEGKFPFIDHPLFYKGFKRIQLNLSSKRASEVVKNLTTDFSSLNKEVIFGGNYNDIMDFSYFAKNKISVLFDTSGGKGVELDTYSIVPVVDEKKLSVGYAGGLTPLNIASKMKELNSVLDPDDCVWIDMETGIRTDNDLDLNKCFDIYNALANFMDEIKVTT